MTTTTTIVTMHSGNDAISNRNCPVTHDLHARFKTVTKTHPHSHTSASLTIRGHAHQCWASAAWNWHSDTFARGCAFATTVGIDVTLKFAARQLVRPQSGGARDACVCPAAATASAATADAARCSCARVTVLAPGPGDVVRGTRCCRLPMMGCACVCVNACGTRRGRRIDKRARARARYITMAHKRTPSPKH